jgi:hypothetical protein
VRRLRVLLALCSLLLVGDPLAWRAGVVDLVPDEAARGAVPDHVAGQLLLGFDPASDPAVRAAIVAARGGTILRHLAGIHAAVVAPRPARPLGEEARAFAAAPGVRYVEPHHRAHAVRTPNDPRYTDPQRDEARWALEKIGAPEAWGTTTGSPEIVVGVVDTGVEYTSTGATTRATAAMWPERSGRSAITGSASSASTGASASWR